jgi:16S rRNA (guanine1207-N2)-methyltransferase
MLIEGMDLDLGGTVLVVGTREAVGALAAARLFPAAEVHFFTLDAFELHRARETLILNQAESIRCHLGADLPHPGSYDWVIFPASHAGDSMLTVELLREARGALKPRGKILAATDNQHDRWLHDRILEVFGSATIHLRAKHGVAYIARKQPDHELRPRDYSRVFGAIVLGTGLELESRPGIFSHGKLDEGTLALSEMAKLEESSRVVDLGCGSGALGIRAALAAPRGFALLADSSVRAVQAARKNILRNRVEGNSLAVLSYDLSAARDESFDLALANPPYYGDYRILESFAREAHRVLLPGGDFFLVTKTPERPQGIVNALFGNASVLSRRGYAVVRGKKGRG